MKLVKAHENAELVKGSRKPKRKTKGTREPMSRKKPMVIPSHWGKE